MLHIKKAELCLGVFFSWENNPEKYRTNKVCHEINGLQKSFQNTSLCSNVVSQMRMDGLRFIFPLISAYACGNYVG